VLAFKGMPVAQDVQESEDYSKYVDGGATSRGVEYISALANLFRPESRTEFRIVDTDLVRGRRTLVYEFEVKQQFSTLTLTVDNVSAVAGSRGRLWIDRETNRVLRFEQIATDVKSDFPLKAASTVIDYEWVTIGENKYLLPSNSEILMTVVGQGQTQQSRNEIRFRGYQKFSAELKVIDVIDDDFPPEPEKPEPNPPTP